MKAIVQSTHSRIPVYGNGDRSCILGVLFVKLIIAVDPEGKTAILVSNVMATS